MKTVMITGATSGFGRAMAQTFAAKGHNVIITGRRADRLNDLQQELTEDFPILAHPLVFDVRQKEAVFNALAQLPVHLKTIDILINNAGLALGRDYFEEADLEDWETMIDTNLKGMMYVTKAVIPGMIDRKEGHIINMGSIAGKEVYERGNGYCASKFGVDALSQSMRVDLLRHNIKVTAIHPGAAETEFSMVRFKGNEAAAQKIYEGYQPLSAQDVADVVYYTASVPPHVCINDLVLTCLAQANSFYLHRGA